MINLGPDRAHIARKNLKQTNASVHLVQYRFKIRGGSPENKNDYMEERIFEWWVRLKSKTEGVIWWEKRWWLWWG